MRNRNGMTLEHYLDHVSGQGVHIKKLEIECEAWKEKYNDIKTKYDMLMNSIKHDEELEELRRNVKEFNCY